MHIEGIPTRQLDPGYGRIHTRFHANRTSEVIVHRAGKRTVAILQIDLIQILLRQRGMLLHRAEILHIGTFTDCGTSACRILMTTSFAVISAPTWKAWPVCLAIYANNQMVKFRLLRSSLARK